MADTMRKNTDAGTRGGAVRSSKEALVTSAKGQRYPVDEGCQPVLRG
jgi:hypothetical protein